MKKLSLLVLFSIFSVAIFAQQKNFKLNVTAKNIPADSKLFIRYIVNNKLILDSAFFNKNQLQYQGEIQEPTMIILFLSKKGIGFGSSQRVTPMDKLTFYAEPSKKTTTIRFDQSFKNAVVKGTTLQKSYAKYTGFMTTYDQELEQLMASRSSLYQATPRDEAAVKEILAKIEKANGEKDKAKLQFVQENPGSYFSLLALKEVAGYEFNNTEIEPLFNALSSDLKNSAMGKKLETGIESAKKFAVGKTAENFTQNDTLGKPVSLSDFRGKYVLLDFWASWCGPCRAENPHVVAAFNKYKDRKFTVLGVSLDKSDAKDKWMEAIRKDGLTWTHVSDLQYWDNAVAKQYDIHAIPQNFLIDPTGKIIAKNIRGEELQKKLAELLD